eukprot:TRINITY_DN22947_c0_g1_i1.p1 TRINITY_DN22947_c0_g1~~TRINITY_DN22947_c0_g1_i1.p1  ORF type:complete len:148 (+),score=38.43 TRINITY_DN22947_c0_g1_i1:29-445(+)
MAHYHVYEFQAACCDNLLIKSASPDFPSDCLGTFELYLDVEYQPFICYNANVFKKENESMYLYRSKFGNWVIGRTLGKIKKGSKVRSHEDDPQKYTRNCPCKVDKWQMAHDGRWKDCDSMKVMIRRHKMSINCDKAGS